MTAPWITMHSSNFDLEGRGGGSQPCDAHTHTHTCSELSLRNLFVECILHAKTIPLNLTGVGHWKDLKNSEAAIAIASPKENELEADPSLSTKPYRSQLDRLRKPCRSSDIKLKSKSPGWFERTVWNIDTPVLGLAGCHNVGEKQCRYKWLIKPHPPKCHSFVIGKSAPARLISSRFHRSGSLFFRGASLAVLSSSGFCAFLSFTLRSVSCCL